MSHRAIRRFHAEPRGRWLAVAMASSCLALGGGCGGGGATASGHGSSDAAARPTAADAPTLASGTPVAVPASAIPPPPTASASAVGGVPEPAGGFVTTGTPLDPQTIEGSVYSKQVSSGIPPALDATVSTTDAAPWNDYLVGWDIGLRDGGGHEHHLYCYAPKTLPLPVRVGEAVRVHTSATGGGPNRRYSIRMHSRGGVLLLAVNELPIGWSVARGTSTGKTPMGGYDQVDYRVSFEHEGQRLEPESTRWARLTAGPRTYYVWGHGAERSLHPGKPPMPDYVGGWLDFAIVLAR